nr:acyl-coenzyme A thioesterase 11-like [Oncorhynchus nerka]
MARKHTLSCKEEAPISVPRDKRNQVYLGFNNVAALTVLTGETRLGKPAASMTGSVCLSMRSCCFVSQVQMVMASALHAFTLLADLTLRPLWGTLSL